MIAESQFEELAGALASISPALLEHVSNNPSNVIVSGLDSAQLKTVFGALPAGAWPEFVLNQEPPARLKNAWSLHIIIFKKDTKAKK
jgi:hypothetical protein